VDGDSAALHGHHHLVPPPVEERRHGLPREDGGDERGPRRPGLKLQALLGAVHGQGELGREGTMPRSGTAPRCPPATGASHRPATVPGGSPAGR